MIQVIPFKSLGLAKHGWLTARHHFSFARYYDPQRMGYPPLLVWNDDEIKADTGFPMHPHDNMEIITFVREGAVSHKDDQGNSGVTEAGSVQVMSAGTGIFHSEHAHPKIDTVLFQIWIQTGKRDVDPRWETRTFPRDIRNELRPLASGRSEHADLDVLMIHQDAAILTGIVEAGASFDVELGADRHAYLVPSTGKIRVNGEDVNARDGLRVDAEAILHIEGIEESEVVLADLPHLHE